MVHGTGPAPSCRNQRNSKIATRCRLPLKQTAKSLRQRKRCCSLANRTPTCARYLDRPLTELLFCDFTTSNRSACNHIHPSSPLSRHRRSHHRAAASNTSAYTSTGNTLACGRRNIPARPREQRQYPNAAPSTTPAPAITGTLPNDSSEQTVPLRSTASRIPKLRARANRNASLPTQ